MKIIIVVGGGVIILTWVGLAYWLMFGKNSIPVVVKKRPDPEPNQPKPSETHLWH